MRVGARSAALAAVLATLLAAPAAAAEAERTLQFGAFGTVTLYGDPAARNIVLFVSGDGGWNLGVIDMARSLAELDSLVVGIDIRRLLGALAGRNETCSYPAADFEALSQFVQRETGRTRYTRPVLVGYSSGATLVYAVQVQAPPATFAGSMSLGFCPDLPIVHPFCKGHGLEQEPGPKGKGFSFLPAQTLERPWIAFQGAIDQVCDPGATRRYVAKVPKGQLVWLPEVGHGYSKPPHWLPQFKAAFATLLADPANAAPAAPPPEVGDLPLVELPAASPNGDELAVILSGDGGWAGLDKEVAGALGVEGIPVVGWDSLQYYWRRRDPATAANDLARLLRHYLATWKRERVLLIGYSFGADVAAFLVSRLPEELRSRVALVTLIGVSPTAQFEFHVAEWLGKEDDAALPVSPELERLRGIRVLCLFGEKEDDSPCRTLPAAVGESAALPGGHHFGGDYSGLARRILAAARPGAR